MMMSRGRAGNGLVFNRMVLASLFLHVLFLSCFFLSPSLPEKKWTFGPVYSVELVSGPVNLEDGKDGSHVQGDRVGSFGPRTNGIQETLMRAVLLPFSIRSPRSARQKAIRSKRRLTMSGKRCPGPLRLPQIWRPSTRLCPPLQSPGVRRKWMRRWVHTMLASGR